MTDDKRQGPARTLRDDVRSISPPLGKTLEVGAEALGLDLDDPDVRRRAAELADALTHHPDA